MSKVKSKSPFFDKKIILENDSAFSIYDRFPISNGHALIVPKREVFSIFELKDDEYQNCFNLVRELKNFLISEFVPDAFNIGINDGVDAGQTIHHAHIHIIPRYHNDLDNPRGGVRNILPDNTGYKQNAIQVVAAIIKKDKRILIARRSKDKELGGLWEYAGGKLEPNESDEECLKRELKEEFEITVQVGKFITNSLYKYPNKTINLKVYEVNYISGEFKLNDHDLIEWVAIEDLSKYKFAPADITINDYILKNGV